MFSVGDMFSGVGGIALGFKQAGFSILWGNDFDKFACETYSLNFPEHRLYADDVKNIDPSDLKYVDVITAGFPCPAFSVAGYQKGFNDPRGELFFDVVRFIDVIRPKVYLLENVRNLVSHDKGRTFKIIKHVLIEELNYSFIPFILSAYEHGDIPQSRQRVYIVGFRDESKHFSCTNNFLIPKSIELTKNVRDFIFDEKQDDKYYFKPDHKYMPKLLEVVKFKDTLYQWRRTHVRENKRNMCPTLTANMGMGGHNVPLLLDNWGIRKLIPRECFNFQGFPNDFRLPDNVCDSRLYKQAGNSVIVTVIERIAKAIKNTIS